jgi:hypothetical protein
MKAEGISRPSYATGGSTAAGTAECRRPSPDVVLGDRGYDHDKYRRLVRALGVRPRIARRGTEHGSGPGKQRRVVEQAIALLHSFRGLRIRWQVREDIHRAFLRLGCALTAGTASAHCVSSSYRGGPNDDRWIEET